MDENLWKIIEIGMWAIGLQTAFITAIIGFVWTNLSKKIDSVQQELNKKIDAFHQELNKKNR